ncbi:hypothetical protein K435DRAFT_782681 [Dendrothele bispora CBS 962.96]|uniref:Uncharacterized protein n=1 Tax=Dendrothele bispora (strain CBS 962.96) TaxID=1314807 RepID=A0A4V4HDH7_DENBC|nr:hypothetical protein K435DRAFT_782681 [Dendrothele bispora CBS 962.96]
MGTVWKMVDDTDGGIEYTGDWRPSFGNDIIDGVGVSLNDSAHSVFGPVFNNTVHSVLTAGTSLKFRFNGTSHAALYGSNVRTPNLNGSFVMECLLDNVSVGADGGQEAGPVTLSLTPTGTLVHNNQVLCRSGEAKSNLVVPGEHELVFNVLNSTGTTAGLFVDYIVYETLPDASVDGDILQMGNGEIDFPANRDQHLSFSPGWVETAHPFASIFTYTPGSSVTVKFNGTGIQLYGELMGEGTPSQLASNPMIYQLDDQDPMGFQLFPFGDDFNRTHQILFDMHSLSPNEHTVVVTHNGTASGMPLIVDYFQVTSLTSNEQASLSSGVPSGLSFPPSRHQQKSAIIGGAVGGALLFSLVTVGAVIFLWKRNRQGQRQRKGTTGISPLYVESSGADFNPYSLESSFHTRRTTKPTMEGSHPHDMSSTPMEDINVVRTRNLKLQQRLTMLQTPVSGNRHEEQLPITHTDSGWRMREEDRQELPPNYAEA